MKSNIISLLDIERLKKIAEYRNFDWKEAKQFAFQEDQRKGESIKKRGVFHFSLYHLYSLGETQILTDLSALQNEELFHKNRPSRRKSDDLASPSDSRLYVIS